MSEMPPEGFYARQIREDAAKIEGELRKTLARLRNAADMCERRHIRQEDLADAVRNALRNGKVGKQTRRRLKQALRDSA